MTGSDAAQDVAVNDPARSIDKADEAVAEVVSDELSIAPLGIGDRVVQDIMAMMRAGEWDGRKSAKIVAARHQVEAPSVMVFASQAGRYLRLHREPDQMLGYLVGKLHEIVEANQPDRVPAIKTLLDQLEKMESRRLKNGQPTNTADILAAAEAALDDPPPELVELLERKWGKKTVGT